MTNMWQTKAVRGAIERRRPAALGPEDVGIREQAKRETVSPFNVEIGEAVKQ
jgi:hypothetical protein